MSMESALWTKRIKEMTLRAKGVIREPALRMKGISEIYTRMKIAREPVLQVKRMRESGNLPYGLRG